MADNSDGKKSSRPTSSSAILLTLALGWAATRGGGTDKSAPTPSAKTSGATSPPSDGSPGDEARLRPLREAFFGEGRGRGGELPLAAHPGPMRR